MKCPESLEQLQELERLLPLCKRELFEQAQARIASGAANSQREAARQLGEELGRSPEGIRTALKREQGERVGSVNPVMQEPEYEEEQQNHEIETGSPEWMCESPPDENSSAPEIETPQPEASKPLPRGALGTGENEWYTPIKYIDLAKIVLGTIDLDPASSEIAQQSIQAASFFTKDDNGLEQEWRGKVWLNPPYMQPDIALFVDKLVAEFQSGRVSEAILLTHNYTDTTWFHKAENACSVICFTRGRIRFVDANGNLASPTRDKLFSILEPTRMLSAFTSRRWALFDNGYNPMRWDCGKDGSNCFNKKKRPKIEEFAECFPRNIAMSDVDGTVELNGRFLELEWKSSCDEISVGQRTLFERKTQSGSFPQQFTVFLVDGDAETMVVRHMAFIKNGKVMDWFQVDLAGLKKEMRKWSRWAQVESLEAINSTMQIILTIGGKQHRTIAKLPKSAIKSSGPMSLESGVMGLVRELCQEIYQDMREAV